MECGASSVTLGRRKFVEFSSVVFVDGTGLIAKSTLSGTGLSDLGGKKIGVIAGTSNERALADALKRRVLTATVVNVKTREEGLAQVESGAIDAFASDRVLLIGLASTAKDPKSLVLLADALSFEPYAITLPRGDWQMRLGQRQPHLHRSIAAAPSARSTAAGFRIAGPARVAGRGNVPVRGAAGMTRFDSIDMREPVLPWRPCDHLILKVNDLAASVAFYTDVMGFAAAGIDGPFTVLRAGPRFAASACTLGERPAGRHYAFRRLGRREFEGRSSRVSRRPASPSVRRSDAVGTNTRSPAKRQGARGARLRTDALLQRPEPASARDQDVRALADRHHVDGPAARIKRGGRPARP